MTDIGMELFAILFLDFILVLDLMIKLGNFVIN